MQGHVDALFLTLLIGRLLFVHCTVRRRTRLSSAHPGWCLTVRMFISTVRLMDSFRLTCLLVRPDELSVQGVLLHEYDWTRCDETGMKVTTMS